MLSIPHRITSGGTRKSESCAVNANDPRVQSSVVFLGDDAIEINGLGVAIGDSWIITCEHVAVQDFGHPLRGATVSGGTEFEVVETYIEGCRQAATATELATLRKNWHPGRYLREKLALLRTRSKDLLHPAIPDAPDLEATAELVSQKLARLESTCLATILPMAGFYAGLNWTDCLVSRDTYTKEDGFGVAEGDSGAGIFNAEGGLIAIQNCLMIYESEWRGGAIPAARSTQWLSAVTTR